MAWRVLRREPGGPWSGVNHKRIQRLWREEGLRRPVRTRKRRRIAADVTERLRELEAENARLKKLVANQALDIDMLKELAEGNF